MLECDGGCKLWNGWEEIGGEKLCVRLRWELCCMQGKADVECVYKTAKIMYGMRIFIQTSRNPSLSLSKLTTSTASGRMENRAPPVAGRAGSAEALGHFSMSLLPWLRWQEAGGLFTNVDFMSVLIWPLSKRKCAADHRLGEGLLCVSLNLTVAIAVQSQLK